MTIDIGRRQFISALGGAAAAWPLAVRAQQPTMPVIGYLRSDSPDASPKLRLEFIKGLNETGYVDGQMSSTQRSVLPRTNINTFQFISY